MNFFYTNWSTFKSFATSRSLQMQYIEVDGNTYQIRAYDGFFAQECSIPKDSNNSDCVDFETNFKPTANQKIGIAIEKLPPAQPFAEPTYRTKDSKISSPVTVPNGQSTNIDYTMPSELYVSGGTIVVKNVQFGDWVEASIVDANGVIPEPYRAATCEAWPVVAQYIIGKYLEVYDSNSIWYKQGVDTRPLVAKITTGLVLRVTYHAANIVDGADREVLVNYFLSRKL